MEAKARTGARRSVRLAARRNESSLGPLGRTAPRSAPGTPPRTALVTAPPRLVPSLRLSQRALFCIVTLVWASACTHVYATETRRGELIRTIPTAPAEATGRVSLALRGEIREAETLELTVHRLIDLHRPVHREYQRLEVDHGVSVTPAGAIVSELANLFLTAGLGHLLGWDWNLGLPKIVCLTEAGQPRSSANDECRYDEETHVLEATELEAGFESLAPKTMDTRLEAVALSLELTHTSRADLPSIEPRVRFDAGGRAAIPLDALVPEGESRLLLEVSASQPEADGATLEAVIIRAADGFHLDLTEEAVADAREAIRSEKEALAAVLARREAEEAEAERQRAAERAERLARDRTREIQRLCPKGIGSMSDLVQTNPYDIGDKCFEYVGTHLQTISRTTALYSLGSNLIYYIDFGRDSAPPLYFQGYVRGLGAYRYRTVSGAVNIIPSLSATRIPLDVPANESE